MTIYRKDLERVLALIERPEAWCQNEAACDANGEYESPKSDKAVKWCIDGAFIRCGLDFTRSEFVLGLPRNGTPEFNDTHTHAEVLALLRAAIERAPVEMEMEEVT